MDDNGPPLSLEPAWVPTPQVVEHANVTAACRLLGLADFPALHRWSIEHREAYWDLVIQRLGIRLGQRYERVLDLTYPTRPRWLVGATINIVDSCFQAEASAARRH